jgi:BTB/POZ domain
MSADPPPSKKQKMTETVVIDPLGDVLIHLQGTTVQVSGNVLSLASSVFRTMLGGYFKDSRKHEIHLPEDDTEPFLLLCKVLHHQQYTDTDVPDATLLLALASLCDKYMCASVMKVHFNNWIYENLNTLQEPGLSACIKLSKLLLVSYIVDSAALFKHISEGTLEVLRKYAKDEALRNNCYKEMAHFLVRHNLSQKIESKRQEIDKAILNALVVMPFSQITDCTCPDGKEKHAGLFMENLCKVESLPIDIMATPVKFIFVRVCILPGDFPGSSRCPSSQGFMKETVIFGIHDIALRGLGLCLDCIKSDGQTGVEDRCRVCHDTDFASFSMNLATNLEDDSELLS